MHSGVNFITKKKGLDSLLKSSGYSFPSRFVVSLPLTDAYLVILHMAADYFHRLSLISSIRCNGVRR